MSEEDIENNIRAGLKSIISLGQHTIKKGCFIDRVQVVSHGKFRMEVAVSEYHERAGRIKEAPPQTAPIPRDSTVPVNPAAMAMAV